jgi:hypothetical protein
LSSALICFAHCCRQFKPRQRANVSLLWVRAACARAPIIRFLVLRMDDGYPARFGVCQVQPGWAGRRTEGAAAAAAALEAGAAQGGAQLVRWRAAQARRVQL